MRWSSATATSAPVAGDDRLSVLEVGRWAAFRRGVRVLDVGSGIGGPAAHLASKYGAKVIGIDLAPEMVAIAHGRGPAGRRNRERDVPARG